MNFLGWSLDNIGAGTVTAKYTVEYVDNPKTWEKICYIEDNYRTLEPKQEPWELYSKLECESISDAISFFMIKFMSDSTFDIKIMEAISVNGEVVLEQYIEPRGTTKFYIRDIVNADMRKRNEKLEEENISMESELMLHREFLNHMSATTTFEKWKKNL